MGTDMIAGIRSSIDFMNEFAGIVIIEQVLKASPSGVIH